MHISQIGANTAWFYTVTWAYDRNNVIVKVIYAVA
jgi:hypothetical protein